MHWMVKQLFVLNFDFQPFFTMLPPSNICKHLAFVFVWVFFSCILKFKSLMSLEQRNACQHSSMHVQLPYILKHGLIWNLLPLPKTAIHDFLCQEVDELLWKKCIEMCLHCLSGRYEIIIVLQLKSQGHQFVFSHRSYIVWAYCGCYWWWVNFQFLMEAASQALVLYLTPWLLMLMKYW